MIDDFRKFDQHLTTNNDFKGPGGAQPWAGHSGRLGSFWAPSWTILSYASKIAPNELIFSMHPYFCISIRLG